MAKIIYCIKCGQKVVDGEYCPKCGSRLEDYEESDKNNKRTRNILLVVLAIALIVAAGTISYLFFFNEHYESVQVSGTASLEMPVGKGLNGFYVNNTSMYQVDNGKGVVVMSYNSKDSDLASAFAFAALKEKFVGSRFNDGGVYQTTINGTAVWSIASGNNNTHDNIIISSFDRDLTLKIYNSIKYNMSNITNDTVNVDNVNTKSSSDSNSHNSNQDDKYLRDENGNIRYAHTDAPGPDGSFEVPMTKDGKYTYKSSDEPNSPSGWWVDKS